MAIPVSASINQLNAEVFLQEGYELSLDAIVPSIELTGSFTPFKSKVQFYIYDYSQTLLYQNTNYSSNGSYLPPESELSISNSTSSYNQFEINPTEDVYNQGYSSGNYYALYNFIDYELGSELIEDEQSKLFEGHPYFLAEISGDRTELRIQNNFLTQDQIKSYYNQFNNKINARENVDEFYISFDNNRNFIAINSQLEIPTSGSISPTSILIKLYKPLPSEFEIDQQLQIISKVGETQVYSVDFQPNLEFVDNLLSLKGPNYNVDIKDRVNNSTSPKNLNDLINTANSQSYYQFNNLRDQKGIILRKDWSDWSQFIKYSSAEERLNNFKSKLSLIESYETELAALETITGVTSGTSDYSSSYNNISNNISNIIRKFDSYEYFLYYITGSNSWPKYSTTYPYKNYSVTSSAALNWFGSTDELDPYYNTGKNQILSASLYDENNQDYLYYLIPPFITNNSNNNQYLKFVNMTGQTFDEMYLYTEAVEQVRNTNSSLTGDVLPLGLADEVIESLGFETYGNDFNSIGFNVNGVGVLPSAGSGLEYIDRYIDIASGSVINYYDQQESTLGYVIALADPSFPYPIDNAAQEIYKRIFHNMVSLVKRKGTVTGLRQLINIWGVPNTMLRISEFGGKNKDDENDYDLWMNRYSTAFNSYATPSTSSIPNLGYLPTQNANVSIPWQPLVANYVDADTPGEYAVADCIQFRFKTARSATGETNFSESVLLKRGNGSGVGGQRNNGEFGIFLHQSGSNSGSYSGSIMPHYNTYASMSFVLSGSIDEGASFSPSNTAPFNYGNVYVTDPIYLPFYNKEWWTVQIQRKTHIPKAGANNTLNEFELKVGQNIYNGYDGNEIGWLASSSLTMPDGKISSSMNAAWNYVKSLGNGLTDVLNMMNYEESQVYIPGNIIVDPFAGSQYVYNFVGKQNDYFSKGYNLGDPMSGSFQEVRYYRRALSSSQFNDLIMNPESIQGHSDSNYGPGSSFDLLSFRAPLGNELEFTEPNGSGSYYDNSGTVDNIRQFIYGSRNPIPPNRKGNSQGSVHPAVLNSPINGYYQVGSIYTGSFLSEQTFGTTDNQYINGYSLNFRFDSNPNLYVTASYIVPNTEINYMDQPSAGIRNRIKNKIQVIDGNEYGTILSPFRSIQQEFEQSSSYTEDLNSLEVGFSFQNEINDDIISTFGHGVVSDAIADPRFISESNDRYPELTRIAENYFKKYAGFGQSTPLNRVTDYPHMIESEFDYNRLIKFYETSLFKAIKNYVPARTSLSTGIIVKQHLLERNKATTVPGININTPIVKTPETGSDVYGYTDQTGFNSVISQRNLLITSSIPMETLTGSAGGSVNKYNNLKVNTLNFNPNQPTFRCIELDNIDIGNGFVNLFGSTPTIYTGLLDNMVFSNENGGFLETLVAYEGQLIYDFSIASGTGNNNISIEIRSNRRGVISTFSAAVSAGLNVDRGFSPFFNIYPNEEIKIFAKDDLNDLVLNSFQIEIGVMLLASPLTTLGGQSVIATSASQQAWFYLDDFTGDYKIKNTQDEFYNGEYSGSNFEVIPPQYNPYRIFADGTNLNRDTVATPNPTLNLNNGSHNANRFNSVTTTSANTTKVRNTGSLLPGGSGNPASGSKSGATSSDQLLFRSIGGSSLDTQTITIASTDGTTRTYVSIGFGSGLNTSNAQNQFLFSTETNYLSLYSTVTALGPNPTGTGTETITLSNGTKTIEAEVNWAGGTWGNATVTDRNPGNQNSSAWPAVGDNFSGANSGGDQVNFAITTDSVTNGLLQIQFMNPGSTTTTPDKFISALESANGHNGLLDGQKFTGQGPLSNLGSVTIKETQVGANFSTPSITTANNFSSNASGVCMATTAADANGVEYLFPTQFEGGADELASSNNFLPNNAGAIVNLTPGENYQLDFDITNYDFDNLGGDGEVGLSIYAADQATTNGVSAVNSRRNSNGSVSATWTQNNNQTTAIFFAEPGVSATISNVVLTASPDRLAKKHLWSTAGYTIEVTGSQIFQNSSYNPIINNVSSSRKNERFLDMDFDPVTPGTELKEGIPNDYTLTVSSSQLGWEGIATNDNLLEFAEVPESNYSILSSANPRYKGSKITSADYNFRITKANLSESQEPTGIFSPLLVPGLLQKSKIRFLNGDTGSWEGDKTSEYVAALESRPIYFAHFKSSYENFELNGTTTFEIDQLIQVPFESIQGEQEPIITSSQLTGNNENLIPVASTFVPKRKLKAVYNQSTKQFRNLKQYKFPLEAEIVSPVLNYSTLNKKSNYITFPAQDIVSYYTNEKTNRTVILTHSIDAPNYINPVKSSIRVTDAMGLQTLDRARWDIINTANGKSSTSTFPGSDTELLTQSIQPIPLGGSFSSSASTTLLVTGSSPNGDANGYGLLYLQGMMVEGDGLYEYNFGSFSPSIRSFNILGPHLQLINNNNTNVDIGDISYSSSTQQYLFPDGSLNSNIDNTCAQWDGGLESQYFGPWPYTVSTFVKSPLDPGSGPDERKGGGLPDISEDLNSSNAKRGIDNYYVMNYSRSVVTEYTDNTLPIQIKRGDEIRVTYAYPLLDDAVSNDVASNEIITQTFSVLGYEQAPPSLITSAPYPYDGLTNIGWYTSNGNLFYVDIRNLPPTGFFSPNTLKEKFDLLATNGQKVLAYNLSTNDDFANCFSGSIDSCEIITEWGQPSGSSDIIAPTGSIRIGIRGLKSNENASGADDPAMLFTTQEILRTSMNSQDGTYHFETSITSNIPPLSSNYLYVLNGSNDDEYYPIDPGFIYDTLKVTPNPSTLEKPIPKGSIMSATFKRRVDDDTKVIVDVIQPVNQKGNLTPSGDGYLIPDDLSPTQQDNVQKIINILKSKNSFTNPPDANETKDVS